jgi:hypothetical protein
VLPLARVKKLIKGEPDVKAVSSEAIFLIGRAVVRALSDARRGHRPDGGRLLGSQRRSRDPLARLNVDLNAPARLRPERPRPSLPSSGAHFGRDGGTRARLYEPRRAQGAALQRRRCVPRLQQVLGVQAMN